MAVSQSVARAPVPWTERLFAAVPLSPVWTGVAIAAALLGVFVSLQLALGRFALYASERSSAQLEDMVIAVVQCLMAAYLATAYTYALRAARSTLDQLRPILRGSPAEVSAWTGECARLDKRRLRTAGLVGALIAGSIPEVAELRIPPGDLFGMSPEAIWHRVAAPILGWLVGCFAYVTVYGSRKVSEIGRDRVEIDLLDSSPLTPFARHGLRNALLWMGFLGVGALNSTVWEAALWLPAILSVLLAGGLVVAATTLILPVRGVRRAIHQRKQREFEWCNAEIRRARVAFGADAGAGGAAPPLADLVAYRGMVESVPEWPFGVSTFARLLLYAAIPLGSWLGGAMVERAVDALLG